MRAIIAAAGPGLRWNNHLGVPKHLVEINGERLIDRTVRLLREHGVEDIVITAPPGDTRYHIPGVRVFEKEPEPYQIGRFLPESEWNPSGRTVWLYGDAYYSRSLIAEMMRPVERWTFYVRLRRYPWRGYVRNRAVHAFSFERHEQPFVAERIQSLIDLQRFGHVERSIALDLYRWMAGEPPHMVRRRKGDNSFAVYEGHAWLQPVDDVSTDFDWPEDYEAFIARYDPERDQ